MQYSVVNFSELEGYALRIDADYYHPAYLDEDKKIKKFKLLPLGEVSYITDGQHGYHEIDPASNISHLTAKNVKNWFADKINADPLAKWVDDKNQRSSLKENDLILSTRGTVGFCAIVKDDVLPANIDQDVARIFIQNISYISPEVLISYVNAKHGQDWILRNASGMVQQGLSLDKLRMMPIPSFNNQFQIQLIAVIQKAYNKKNESEKCYSQAQTLLLSELGLLNWQPKHRLTFVKKYSDAQQAGRMDAEYFRPKYEEIIIAIKSYSGGWDSLKNLAKLEDINFNPRDKTEYKYIELSNIADNGEIADCMIEKGQDLPSRARRKVATGDVIVSSIEGSLSSIALIQKEYNQALCSTGFYVVNSRTINSETLLVVLKSMIGQFQFKKGCSGTILTAINKDEFQNVILPIVNNEIQAQIQQKITESLTLRKQSKHLLECAKRAVEIAIEQDEQAAIRWLENEIKETDRESVN